MEPYKTPKSDELAELGRRVIPGATINNWRGCIEEHPVYISRGKGARLYDLDGNEYVDYTLGHGPGLLGYGNKKLLDTIVRQAHRLYVPAINDLEAKAAEKITQHVECADLVTFTCSGTEANLGAIRAARAYTGRDCYLRFAGHYHGGLDHIMGGVVLDSSNPKPVQAAPENDFFAKRKDTLGRYSKAFDPVFMTEWNDLPALEEVLSKFGKQIAALIMEPVMINNRGCLPEPGYLEGVRELCAKHGVVLIFDEVLTGFRIGLKSAQGYFGITPDLTTMGKAVAAGFPVSLICGKREIMDTISRADVVQGGTFNAHPLGMAMLIAAVSEYEKDNGSIYRHIENVGQRLKEGLDRIALECNQPLLLQGFPGAWVYSFNPKKKIVNNADGLDSDHEKVARFPGLLRKYGVLTEDRFCTSAAHTEEDIDLTLERAHVVMELLQNGL